jgi:hypothetical protein
VFTAQTSALVTGTVFEDRDHDRAFGVDDAGFAGVRVTLANSGNVVYTTGREDRP